jgi:hypothetical protein
VEKSASQRFLPHTSHSELLSNFLFLKLLVFKNYYQKPDAADDSLINYARENTVLSLSQFLD